MPIEFIDRQPTKPGRIKLTPENGEAAFYATMERADEPTVNGTPLSAGNLNEAQETLAYTTEDGISTWKRVYVSPTGSDDNDGVSNARAMATIKGAIRKYAKWYKQIDVYLADGTYTENIGAVALDQCSLSIRSTSENRDGVTINMATMLETHVNLFRLFNLTLNVTDASVRAVSINAGLGYLYNVKINMPTASTQNCINVYNGSSAWVMECVINAGTGAAVYGNQAMHIRAVNCTSERTLKRGFYANNGAVIEYTPTITATQMTYQAMGGKCVPLSIRADSIAGTMGSLYGQYKTSDGLLLQWGTVNITPTVANEPTYATVTFPLPYQETPTVMTTPISTVPEAISVAVLRSGEYVSNNKLNVGIALTRTGLTATGINWVAIGKGAV